MSDIMIKASDIYNMFIAGANSLNAEKEYINELNVFPVPDGDTGSNMSMTITAASKELQSVENVNDIQEVCKAISMGALKGARGNSGVILSQLLRGFTRSLAEAALIDKISIAAAYKQAYETAYKAVMKPKEGTILSVAGAMSKKAQEIIYDDDELIMFITRVIKEGDEALAATPEQLPVLKQAGVVDSGGQGLMTILHGAFEYLTTQAGADVRLSLEGEQNKTANTEKSTAAKPNIAEADIKFGYCTEFIILLSKSFTAKDEKSFKGFLESIGDSIVCVSMDDIVKVHVHTDNPGLALQNALRYGQLNNVKIDNMRIEHHERVIKNAEKESAAAAASEPVENKKYGFVAVSAGQGLDVIFESMNVDQIIPGGQTMNPSTQDILNAVKSIHADNIFILPNNKNIILAANQAKDMTSDKNIIVIPTKTVPQGIASILSFMPDFEPDANAAAMSEAAGAIKTGQVTYAVRDTVIDDMVIKQDDIMGIGDTAILAVGTDIDEVVLNMLDKMIDEDSTFISLYYGNEIKEAMAAELMDKIQAKYTNLDIEVNYGGQPVYYYILSVE